MRIQKGKRYIFNADECSYKATGVDIGTFIVGSSQYIPFIDVTQVFDSERKPLPSIQPESTVVWVNMDKVTFIAEAA